MTQKVRTEHVYDCRLSYLGLHLLPPPGRLCLTRRLLVCLLATSRKSYSLDLHYKFSKDVSLDKKVPWSLGSHTDSGPNLPEVYALRVILLLMLMISLNIAFVSQFVVFYDFFSFVMQNDQTDKNLTTERQKLSQCFTNKNIDQWQRDRLKLVLTAHSRQSSLVIAGDGFHTDYDNVACVLSFHVDFSICGRNTSTKWP